MCRLKTVKRPAWIEAMMAPLFDSGSQFHWSLDHLDVMTQVDATTVDVDAMYSTIGIWVHGVPLPQISQSHTTGEVKKWPSVMVYSLTNPDIGVRLFCVHTGAHVATAGQAGAVRVWRVHSLPGAACCMQLMHAVDAWQTQLCMRRHDRRQRWRQG
jgi:hypothetical protein